LDLQKKKYLEDWQYTSLHTLFTAIFYWW
jgi:hypothetical protein